MLKRVQSYLKMPSTWRGIFLGAGLIGFTIAPEQQEAVVLSTATLLGFIEIIRNEDKK